MRVQWDNSWSTADGEAGQMAWLEDYLSVTTATFVPGHGWQEERIQLVTPSGVFPSGLLPMAQRAAAPAGVPIVVDDRRAGAIVVPNFGADLRWLRPYQARSVAGLVGQGRGICKIPTGGGKCLGLGTRVLRYDGRTVPVEDVQAGDLLMGPDSRLRRVLSTTRGVGELVRVVPVKGEPWVCNIPHVLTLIHTTTGEAVDVPVEDWIRWSKTQKHLHKLFQPTGGVVFPAASPACLPVDPYFLGVWFGDGRRDLQQGVQISKPDPEIEQCCADTALEWGLEVRRDEYKSCPTFRLVDPLAGRARPNPLTVAMRAVVGDALTLPQSYLCASQVARAEFLAGLLDTDGHLRNWENEIVQDRVLVSEGVAFLARSLGLRVTSRIKTVAGKPYHRLVISGEISRIPLRIPRKQAGARRQKKDALRTGFRIDPLGVGEYAGFTLDGDGRFLLGDFTVTHNTEVIVGLTRALPAEHLMLCHRTDLVRQAADRYQLRTRETAGVFSGPMGWKQGSCNFTVCTFQAAHKALKSRDPRFRRLMGAVGVLHIDEVHGQAARTYYHVTQAFTATRHRFGFSGTPLHRGDLDAMRTIGAMGPVVTEVTYQELVAAGVLASPRVTMVPCEQFGDTAAWRDAYSTLVVRSKRRNRLLADMADCAAKPCLVFVEELAQGQHLVRHLAGAGLKAGFVHGKMHADERRVALRMIGDGSLDVLVCTVIFQEGIDVPELRSVVVGGGKQSAVACLQRVGRGMRRAPGKDTFEVWDVDDRGQLWLENHAQERRNTLVAEGIPVTTLEGMAAAWR